MPIRIYNLFFLLLLLVTPVTYAADAAASPKESPPPELAEEFIEFVIAHGKGVHFFRVMMNEEEEPYLDVQVILNDWLEIPTTCDTQRQYCQGTLYPDETIFWIDAQQKQMGNNKKGQPQPTVDPNDIAFIDNKVWLKYSAFPDWIPVNVAWTLYRYAMSMTANFLSLDEQKLKREFDRKKYIATREENERIAKVPRIKPDDEMPLEMRYDLNLGYKKDQPVQTNASLQLLADIGQGTLQMNTTFEGEQFKSNVDSYQYSRYGDSWYHHMIIGSTNSFSSQLIGARRLTDGFTIETQEKVKGAGKFEFWDVFQPKTEVDVFKNGILVETIVTDDSGNFHLPEQLAAGGDRFAFKKYYTNGQVETSSVQIAPDDALLQQPGSWDINGAVGRMDSGELLQTNIRYGVTDWLSLGAHVNLATFDREVDNIADADTTDPLIEKRKEQGLSFDATWRLGSQTNLQYEYLQLDSSASATVLAKKSKYHAVSLRITAFEQQQLVLNYFKVDTPDTSATPSADPFLPRNNLINNLVVIDHGLNVYQWNITSQLSARPKQTLLVQDFSKRLLRKLSFRGGYTLVQTPADGLKFEANIGSNTNLFEDKNMQLSLVSDDSDLAADIRYRLQGGVTGNHWDLDLKANHVFGQKTRIDLTASWRYKEHSTIDFTTDGKSFGLEFTYRGAAATRKPKLNFKQFATGTVYGNIMSPAKKGKPPEPIVGLKIMAGSAIGRTDSNGDFEIHGVATQTDILVKYDNNSLDVSYMLDRQFDKVNLRPGTRVRLSPQVIGSVGFDGVVLSTTKLPLNTELVVSKKDDNSSNNSHVTTIAVEEDGFFLTEQLVAGEYILTVINIDNPPPPYHLSISPEQDWVGGIELARPGAKKRE